MGYSVFKFMASINPFAKIRLRIITDSLEKDSNAFPYNAIRPYCSEIIATCTTE
jgi:hypothetical protein